MSNTRTQKERPYNPFRTVAVKSAKVGTIRCFVKAVKPNMKDYIGIAKTEGEYYNNHGRYCTASHPSAERYSCKTVYYYEVGASDGSYRKCVTKEEALKRFEQLVDFEKRQTEIR